MDPLESTNSSDSSDRIVRSRPSLLPTKSPSRVVLVFLNNGHQPDPSNLGIKASLAKVDFGSLVSADFGLSFGLER